MGARKRESAERQKEIRKQTAFAKLNDVPTSPRKMRLVAAKNEADRKELENGNVCVQSIMVGQGRSLKRIRTAPQGRAARIRKRSNHVTIVLGQKSKTVKEEQ